MTFYSIVLFVHVAAVLTLFATLSIEVLSLSHLRRAVTPAEVQVWLKPVPGLPAITLSSLVAVVISGVYLATRMSAFGEAWIKVTGAAILLVAPLAGIAGRRMRAIDQVCSHVTAISSELRERLRDPILKISLGVRITVVLGIVLLMEAKPLLPEALATLGAAVALGLVVSLAD